MTAIETGRRLDRNGTPIDGTGFEVEEGSHLEKLLAERVSPLYSQPDTGEWVTELTTPEETDGEYTIGLGIFTPGNAGPAKHIHPSYEETFEVVAGEFVLELDGEEHFLTEDEELTVPTGVEHTFRCVSEETGATVTTARPAGRLGAVVGTLFGLAHEGKLTGDGRPRLLQAMVISNELAEDTVFTSPPPTITRALSTLLAPIARTRGYEAIYPEYDEASFWEAHVEQPGVLASEFGPDRTEEGPMA